MGPMGQMITEQEVRELRDRVFDQAATDKNWDACRSRWMRPDSVEWLQQKAAKPLTQHNQTES